MKKYLFFTLLCVNLLIWSINFLFPSNVAFPETINVVFFDAGQGDAAFIEFTDGYNMLIDGGLKFSGELEAPQTHLAKQAKIRLRRREYDTGKRIIAPYFRKRGIKRISIIVLTHPHSDHLGGLLYIIKNFKVDMVIDSGLAHTTDMYREFLELIDKKDIRYHIARAGERIVGIEDVTLNILNPPQAMYDEKTKNFVNNNSIVIKMVYGRNSLLFCADIGKKVEEDLCVKYGNILNSNIIKVPHHGSYTSLCPKFFSLVGPRTAIISVGRYNRFGHPHKKIVDFLKDLNCNIYRTDKNGAVCVSMGKRGYTVKTGIP
jgi:competence protein ComEC